MAGCVGCVDVRPFEDGAGLSFPSGREPTANFFFIPNQLPLFLRDRLGVTLLMVAGEPGLSEFKLSDDDKLRRPRNFLTDPGRLLVGLVGAMMLVTSLVRVWGGDALESSDPLLVGDLGLG